MQSPPKTIIANPSMYIRIYVPIFSTMDTPNFLRQCSDLYPNNQPHRRHTFRRRHRNLQTYAGNDHERAYPSRRRLPLCQPNHRQRTPQNHRRIHGRIRPPNDRPCRRNRRRYPRRVVQHPHQYGRYCEVKRTVGVSTTDIINRIIKRSHDHKSN